MVEHILAAQDTLGEGPRWHPGEQALYWVDILGKRVHRLHPATGKHDVWEPEIAVTALGFRAAGGLIVATTKGLAFWSPGGAFDIITDPEPGKPDARLNDGTTDRQGRFWAGTLCNAPTGSLYRLDPDRSLHRMDSGFQTSNGLGWSLDNRIMYFTDSPARIIYAYDHDPATGAITNRRTFVKTEEKDGVPDGLTVDGQGFVWSAFWGGWKVIRYDPAGKVERVVELPVANVTACTFGGQNLDELYITTASAGLKPKQRKKQPLAGDLFKLKTDVKALPEPLFKG